MHIYGWTFIIYHKIVVLPAVNYKWNKVFSTPIMLERRTWRQCVLEWKRLTSSESCISPVSHRGTNPYPSVLLFAVYVRRRWVTLLVCHAVHSVDYRSSRDIDIQRELWTALSCLFVVCFYGSAADRKEGGTIRTLDLNSSIWSVFRNETMLHEAVQGTADMCGLKQY